ncbi:thiamine phosphate synthase [Candidatus Lariskella endosymbiont of Epinotia ramella]|uniref:thiamine phosphate synthase n=1 Tax=Candidatus Lariskella endosymbiont of Epinotia ramella TaxID=3066224 RepID=UPI0030D21F9A
MKDNFLRLVLVTNKTVQGINEYLRFIELCIESGVSSIQLREKSWDDESFRFAESVQEILERYKIPLIINDRVDITQRIGASGVHLGQTDCEPKLARNILGEDKIIGLSVGSVAELEVANNMPIDYIGVGAIFETKTKPDVAHVIGIEQLKKLKVASKHKIVAIGGIAEHNAGDVIATGVDGIAVISAIHSSGNPKKTIESLLNLINMNQQNIC